MRPLETSYGSIVSQPAEAPEVPLLVVGAPPRSAARALRRRPTRIALAAGAGVLVLMSLAVMTTGPRGAPAEGAPAAGGGAPPVEGTPGYMMPTCVEMACKDEVAACSTDPDCRDAISCLFDFATWQGGYAECFDSPTVDPSASDNIGVLQNCSAACLDSQDDAAGAYWHPFASESDTV